MKENVLAIIPARGGSKGILKKNLVKLACLPLIAHTLREVKRSRLVSEHIVSTDDVEIAAVASQFGGKIPYLRPGALAKDETNIIAVVNEILSHDEYQYEYILLLQPTAPLRLAVDIDASIELAVAHEADNVVGFMRVDSFHPCYMYYQDGNKVQQVVPTPPGMRRQDLPPALWRNGAIYLVKTEVFKRQQKFITKDCIPYVMPAERSVNIDSIEDLKLAEYYIKQRQNEAVNTRA